MNSRLAAVAPDVGVLAPGAFKSVGQDWQAVESTFKERVVIPLPYPIPLFPFPRRSTLAPMLHRVTTHPAARSLREHLAGNGARLVGPLL